MYYLVVCDKICDKMHCYLEEEDIYLSYSMHA